MTVLEQITQMKNQGMPDEEIVGSLQQQGVSPQEITDALSQSDIKNAVSGTENPAGIEPPQGPATQEYAPQTQEVPGQEMYAPPTQDYAQQGYDQQGYYPQEGYGSQPATGAATDTIIEVAEQVFSEKVKKIEKQLRDINEFKTLSQTKITNLEERLKRIETIIDKLQITILEKVGSYGKDLQNTKKEMTMMQDSFGKVINHKAHKEKTTHSKTKTSEKSHSKKK